MRRVSKSLLACALIVTGMIGGSLLRGQSRPSTAVTTADYFRWRTELRNWGRWGPDDQRGAGNLITAAKIQGAARLVREGIAISLAPLVPQQPAADVGQNAVFRRSTNYITATGTQDNYQVNFHGLTGAHMDAFCDNFFQGQMYNGHSVAENVTPESGCKKNDVSVWKDGIVTRGVLYDIPQLKGVEWLDPASPVTRADLEAWEKKAGIKVGPGDVILLYTGRYKKRAATGPWAMPRAGYYVDTIPFIRERDVAFVGHDFNIDWAPRPGWEAADGIAGNPVHQAVLVWMGVGIVENMDLEQAIQTARRLKRYEFMFMVAPLPVAGGTGGPVNPIAVF